MFNVNFISENEYVIPYAPEDINDIMSVQQTKQHYENHLLVYYKNLRQLLKEQSIFREHCLLDIIKHSYGNSQLISIYNNASQIFCHASFWNTFTNKRLAIHGKCKEIVIAQFKSTDIFRDNIIATGMKHFGSGYLWVCTNINNTIDIYTTCNAFNPLNIEATNKILICIDLWEHSFYIDYLHRKLSYLQNIYDNIINWNRINDILN